MGGGMRMVLEWRGTLEGKVRFYTIDDEEEMYIGRRVVEHPDNLYEAEPILRFATPKEAEDLFIHLTAELERGKKTGYRSGDTISGE